MLLLIPHAPYKSDKTIFFFKKDSVVFYMLLGSAVKGTASLTQCYHEVVSQGNLSWVASGGLNLQPSDSFVHL